MTSALFKEPSAPETPPEDPDAPTAEAPYGWTVDADTGERRPKKTAGRRRRNDPPDPVPAGTPSLEDLKAGARTAPPREDVAPAQAPRGGFGARLKTVTAPKTPEAVPPFRAGPIAKGVNRLYRRAGKIFRMWDPEIGDAIVACTRKDPDDEDETTVGEAWEELARTNPRVRAFLTKMITAGAFSTLLAAHAPILMAILLKEGIRSRVPLLKLADAFLVDDDDDGRQHPSDLSRMMGGIGPDDMAAMAQMAEAMMGRFTQGMPRGMNDARDVQETG